MSSRKSAHSTKGAAARARRSSVLSRVPVERGRRPDAVEILVDEARRVRIGGIEPRERRDVGESERELAARRAKPSRSSRSTTMAPQISLPWVSATTITCGPGLAAVEGVDELGPGVGLSMGLDVGALQLDGDGGMGVSVLWSWSWEWPWDGRDRDYDRDRGHGGHAVVVMACAACVGALLRRSRPPPRAVARCRRAASRSPRSSRACARPCRACGSPRPAGCGDGRPGRRTRAPAPRPCTDRSSSRRSPCARSVVATNAVNSGSQVVPSRSPRTKSARGLPGPSSEMRPLSAGIEWQLMCQTAPKCSCASSRASFTARW